jgi:hypothetical protein
MDDITAEQREALKIAARMIDAGIPIFAAAPNPDRPGEYYLPKEWEKTVPSHTWLEKWRPGWALGAVGGHAADFLDFDPRNGGHESRRELEIQGQMPRSFGTQRTPSGGTHEVISPTGERKGIVMPGVDLQSGAEQPVHGSHGRGFVFIAPTVRPSKAPETLGQLHAYRWEVEPDLEYLAEFPRGADDTVEGIVARVHARREKQAPERNAFTEAASGDPLFGEHSGPRLFTQAEAEAFCLPYLERLERAQIGEIEECANTAAAALYHFVPAFWDAEMAYAVLEQALSTTAYDPDHPASTWTADKFMAVLDGRRPPLDGWKAERRLTHTEAAREDPPEDAVEALLAEMLTEEELIERPAPQYLIKGLLNLDSEAWTIGEPGCKKSFVVLDQAAHIVKGEAWRGHKVHQGPVVIIAAEGAGGMSTRVKAYRQEYGPIGQGFRMLPRPVQASNAGAWRTLAEACKRIGAVMIVVDTQARVTVGLKENDATDMGIYVEAVRILREHTGACVNTIHHTGRNGGDARGSSAIDGAQSTELKVVKTGPYSGVLKVEKQKDMEEAADIPLSFKRVVVGLDEDGDEVSSLVLVPENAFVNAAGQEEPEAWETGHGEAQVRLIKVLRDQGGSIGLSKAEARMSMIDRFYGGDAKRLPRSTWNTAWTKVLEKEDASGEPLVFNVSGEKYALNQSADLEKMS